MHLFFTILSLASSTVHFSSAVSLQGSIDFVGGGFQALNGGINGLETYALNVTSSFVPLLYAAAIIAVTITGVEMSISQNEDTVDKARRAFGGSVVGLVLLFGATIIKSQMFNSTSDNVLHSPSNALVLSQELAGVVNYFAMLLGVVAVLMIIISGIRAILEFGSGEGLGHIRRTVFGVIFGMVIIGVRGVILDTFYYQEAGNTFGGTANPLITTISVLFQQVFNFLAIIAVAIIIYAGLLMIVNLGNEDQFKKGRDIIIRVGIGFVILFASKAIIDAVFTGITG